MDDNLIKIAEGDQRLGNPAQAILDMIHKRTDGMPFPSVRGVLQIVEHTLIEDQQV